MAGFIDRLSAKTVALLGSAMIATGLGVGGYFMKSAQDQDKVEPQATVKAAEIVPGVTATPAAAPLPPAPVVVVPEPAKSAALPPAPARPSVARSSEKPRPKVAHRTVAAAPAAEQAPYVPSVIIPQTAYGALPASEPVVQQPVCPPTEPMYAAQVAAGTGGAVLGGVLGHQIGGGNGKKIMTIVGAAAGAYAGKELVGNQIDANRMNADQQAKAQQFGCRPRRYGADGSMAIN